MKHKLLNPLRLLLAAICMLGLAAEGQVTIDHFRYQLDSSTNTAILIDHAGLNIEQDTLVIPCEINYDGQVYSVTELGCGAFRNHSGGNGENHFKYVVFPETLKIIGEGAFSYCAELESVNIPDNIEIIKVDAFMGCSSLKSAKLPENITVIPGGLFYGCTSLESIEIPNSVDHFMENWDTPGLDMETIMEDAMTYCEDYTLYYIGGLTFWGCTNLKHVFLPKNLKNIPGYCFGLCNNLTEIEIPSHLEYIASFITQGSNIKSFEFPSSLSSWWNYPFYDDDIDNNAYFKTYHENPAPNIYLTPNPSPSYPWTLYVPKGLSGIYNNIQQWNCFSRIVEATPVELEGEWRTFCAVEDLDFSGVEGLEAYVATEYQDGKVLMEPIEQVPAGTGVVLKGAPGFYEIPYPEQDEALEPVDNLLVGLNYGERITAEDEDGNCNLFFNDATEMASLFYGPFMDSERAPRLNAEGEQPMFAPADGARLPYHRAYLQLPASEAGKTVEMVFGTLTGIEEVEAQAQTDGNIYNLQGQRVVNPGPGIYIQNGRKFIVR